jgi:chorismate dehydratase
MITDLGQEWAKWTGKWMSFAVWAIRKQTVEAYPERIKQIFEAFVKSKFKAHQEPSEMIGEARRSVGGTEAYWTNYFRTLCYDFGPEQWDGLQTYYTYCYELGFLPKQATINIWSEKTIARVTE